MAAGYSRDPARLNRFAPGNGPRINPLHPAETTNNLPWKFVPADFVRLIELHRGVNGFVQAGGTPDGFRPDPVSPDDHVELAASLSIVGNPTEYVPGVPLAVKFTVTPDRAGELAALGFRIELKNTVVPAFWSIANTSTNGGPMPNIEPPQDAFRRFDFFWSDGVSFSSSLDPLELVLDFVPEGESEVITIEFRALSRGGGQYRFDDATKIVLNLDEGLICDEEAPEEPEE